MKKYSLGLFSQSLKSEEEIRADERRKMRAAIEREIMCRFEGLPRLALTVSNLRSVLEMVMEETP